MTAAAALAAGTQAGAALVAPVADAALVTAGEIVDGAAQLLGLGVLAGVLSGTLALVYRWYTRERVPGVLPILLGLGGVAVYLNTTRALREVIAPSGADPLAETVALLNVVTFVVAGLAARGSVSIGDHLAAELFDDSDRAVEREVNRMVQAVGRVLTVELPEADALEDIVGYDPIPAETKAKLGGRTFVFPRRLSVEELHDRLTTRLKADYSVGHVDLELAEDGTVDYLAVGSRAAGIGPTLPPETSAVAVRADPAFAASPGDLVQVWEPDPPRRVLTAELRGVADDVVTLAIDAADTRRLDDQTRYKLVTLPVEPRPDREFASLLRASEETMAAVTVAPDSPLEGQPIGSFALPVVAVRPADGPVEALPAHDRVVIGGERLYVVAKPEAIRTLEAGARSREETAPPTGATVTQAERVGPNTQVTADAPTPTDAPTTADESPTAEADAGSGESGDGESGDGESGDGESGDGESGDGEHVVAESEAVESSADTDGEAQPEDTPEGDAADAGEGFEFDNVPEDAAAMPADDEDAVEEPSDLAGADPAEFPGSDTASLADEDPLGLDDEEEVTTEDLDDVPGIDLDDLDDGPDEAADPGDSASASGTDDEEEVTTDDLADIPGIDLDDGPDGDGGGGDTADGGSGDAADDEEQEDEEGTESDGDDEEVTTDDLADIPGIDPDDLDG